MKLKDLYTHFFITKMKKKKKKNVIAFVAGHTPQLGVGANHSL
jgi:hypothetical protein